jgi:quinol-cytochrome oxidoreductase complex cytochrome b subunit/coenzyme F420-reducing hydrogenase delta subunit
MGFLLIEKHAGRLFRPGGTPFYFLGALSFFFFWLLLITGAYLLIFYRLDIDKAYDSIQGLTDRQPYLGGLIRSLHRYAADGLMITLILHGLRTFLADQYRHARWLAWVSGAVLLGFVWFEGILGYWMVWDDRAQFIALTTAEFLNAVPIFGASLPRAFLSRESVTNIFFWVIIALHIALPVLMLVLLWLHVCRISKPIITPPRRLVAGVFLIMAVLCLLSPATSGSRADPKKLPVDLPLDWFYLSVYPVLAAIPPALSWLLVMSGAALLIGIPWIGSPPRPKPISLFLRRCNACTYCALDCPYEAISMRPRTDGRPYDQEAVVHADLCVSCGICIGSCDTSALILPEYSLVGIRAVMKKRLADQAESRLLVFTCEKAVPAEKIQSGIPWINPIGLPCIGTIHPLLIEDALKSGATGIFMAACPVGDCHFRTGNRLLEERLAGQREPHPKSPLDFSRIRMAPFSTLQVEEAVREVDRFRKEATAGEERADRFRWIGKVVAGVLLAIPALLIFFFSGRPSYSFYNKDESLLIVSLIYTASPKHCRELRPEELEKLPPHMRAPLDCTRARWPLSLRLDIDGEERLSKEYEPSGLWSDGPASVYEKFRLEPGSHEVRITLQERNDGQEMIRSERIEFEGGRAVVFPARSGVEPVGRGG